MSLKADEKWAVKGYEIANAQFAVPTSDAVAGTAPQGALNVETLADGGVRVTGAGFALAFDRATGTLSELARDGRNLLLSGGGPKLHLWRARHRKDDEWAAQGWDRAGLKTLRTEVLDLRAERGPSGEAVIHASVRHVGLNGFAALHLSRTTVYGDGTVAVDNAVSPSGPNLNLARVGVRMLLDPGMSSLNYFARGPMENYSDRKRGSDVGRYMSTVADQLTPYPKPQECGNHEDLRWLSLAGKDGQELLAMADGEPLQFSALPYRDEEMEDVPYSVDLPESTATVLILSGRTLGVGSAACGPRPLPQYRIDSTPRRFSYVLRLGREVAPKAVPKRAGMPPLVSRGLDGRTSFLGEGPVEVSADGQNWREVREPFAVEEATTLRVRAAGFVGAISVEPPPAKLGWRASASDHEPGEGDPRHALDNDPDTIWHSRYNPSSTPPPHRLTVDLVRPTKLGRVTLTPRSDGSNGRIRAYTVETSDDGATWSEAAKGELRDRGDAQTVRFPARTARYVQLTVRSDWSGAGWASLAEFDAGE